MASAENKVIAGVFKGEKVSIINGKVCIRKFPLNKDVIKQYEVITQEIMKSGTSAILRGAVGMALLGGTGILAGLTAKNKGIYTIALEWKKTGDKSLMEIDEKIYKVLVQTMF